MEYLNTIKCEADGMLETVRRYFEAFVKREVGKDNLYHKAQTMIGYPSDKNIYE